VVARVSLRWGLSMLAGSDAIPYWINDSLSWKTVLYTMLLTLFGAAIVGILPALRVTRINVQDALRNESAARSGLKFGGFWTTVIVVQVAITVAFLPIAGGAIDREGYGTDSAALAARARASVDALERRLASEPGVERVTFADRLPV